MRIGIGIAIVERFVVEGFVELAVLGVGCSDSTRFCLLLLSNMYFLI